MTDRETLAALIEEARRAATAVYLAAEAGPAESISNLLTRLCDALDSLTRPMLQTGRSEDFEDGIRSVLMIRCLKHRMVPQLNTNEFTGGECGGCIAEERDEARRIAEQRADQIGSLEAGVTLAPRAPEGDDPMAKYATNPVWLDSANQAMQALYGAAAGHPNQAVIERNVKRIQESLRSARAPSEAPPQPEAFGEVSDPAYRRGEIHVSAPGERYVEMACCGFRFSADHEDVDRKGYSCPMCAPSEAAPEAPNERCPICTAPVQRIEHEVGTAKGGTTELRYVGASGASGAAPEIQVVPHPSGPAAGRALWVDDAKPAPDESYAVARTYEDALRMLRRFEYDTLYLDHDLGDGPTGLDLLRTIRAEGRCPAQVVCISWNPVGRKRIVDELAGARPTPEPENPK